MLRKGALTFLLDARLRGWLRGRRRLHLDYRELWQSFELRLEGAPSC